MISQMQYTGQDVFARTSEADEQLLSAIVGRLEARAKHVFFVQAINDYMDALAPGDKEAILDLGCGTGVVARMIARRDDVKGRITAIDISPYLIDQGKRFAAEEGTASRIDFQAGDAHSIAGMQGGFDVVIMHTLISHVVDPVTVLKEARRLLRPGGRVVVFDGDFKSLTYATDAPDGGAETDRIIGLAGYTQGQVMRMMPRLLAENGFGLAWSRAYVAADIGRADFFASNLAAFRVLLPKSGVMTEAEANAFVETLERASERNQFFCACNFYTCIARRVD
jgi:ubiquinone/menaquinone biosynthesis C-methylase UbiE